MRTLGLVLRFLSMNPTVMDQEPVGATLDNTLTRSTISEAICQAGSKVYSLPLLSRWRKKPGKEIISFYSEMNSD